MTLFEKLIKVMEDIWYLQKDDEVEFGKTKYKALSEEKVTSTIRPSLVKHKILCFPILQEWNREGNITHLNIKYRIQNAEDPDDYIEVVSCGDGADTQDKGSGKAMTYAFKYMWLRLLAIPTGEDPDKISSDELDARAMETSKPISKVQAKTIKDWIAKLGVDEQKFIAYIGKPIDEFTSVDYAKAFNALKKKEDANV